MALYNRGNARRDKHDLEGAIQDYTEAIRLKPDYAIAFYDSANVRYQKGDLVGAIKDYIQSLRLQPDHEDARGKADSSTPKLSKLLYLPDVQIEKDKNQPPQEITILLRSIGSKELDKNLIKTLYKTLISYHGWDRFRFHFRESGKSYLIDFPNDTTKICRELLEHIRQLTGEENWQIKEISP